VAFTLRGALTWDDGRLARRDVSVARGQVVPSPAGAVAETGGGLLLPGLVNGHDHLGYSLLPALGRPPHRSVYEWADEARAGEAAGAARLAREWSRFDRLLLGGLRNLLAGVTAVVHHDAPHPAFGAAGFRLLALLRRGRFTRSSFPVRVLRRYAFAHSPGLEPDLRRTRPRDGRPWMIHAAEGRDERCAGELALLEREGLLDPRTVLVHALGVSSQDVGRIARSGAGVVWCPESNQVLYGARAPVAELLAAGVRLGLGSDSPIAGVRDALSNLAEARTSAALRDEALLRLATRGTADLTGLPAGGFAPAAPADLLLVDTLDGLLAGDRRAVRLVVLAGRALYGEAGLMQQLSPGALTLSVDGRPRALERELGRLVLPLLRRLPPPPRAAWLDGLGAA
jgi:cytosine/adenosine deaminase-related metal-dependent hydrolase